MDAVKPSTLSEVYKALPLKMPQSASENLNPALALVALLHLANEQGLYLESIDNALDIKISKPS